MSYLLGRERKAELPGMGGPTQLLPLILGADSGLSPAPAPRTPQRSGGGSACQVEPLRRYFRFRVGGTKISLGVRVCAAVLQGRQETRPALLTLTA